MTEEAKEVKVWKQFNINVENTSKKCKQEKEGI